ncbi:hypothetical protein CO669_14535 [Bradyrhizobium sp. Y36]|nr:hypothetical protein CO669_14535 [Bradyrhizobium sp. Y36]
MRDTGGGTSANFLHTAARQNKSSSLPRWKRDCVDNPLDKLLINTRKPLGPADLSEIVAPVLDMWKDVNKRARTRAWNCMSPIHRH